MSENVGYYTTKNTTTKKTPPASTEINEIRLPYTYIPLYNGLKSVLKEHFFRIEFNLLCSNWLLIHSRTHICAIILVYSRNHWFMNRLEMTVFLVFVVSALPKSLKLLLNYENSWRTYRIINVLLIKVSNLFTMNC